jgi:hypothetical protein
MDVQKHKKNIPKFIPNASSTAASASGELLGRPRLRETATFKQRTAG